LREADPLIAIAGGEGVNLFNSMGNPWTADYLKASSMSISAAISRPRPAPKSCMSG
jgi:hypothetical protein